MRPNQIEDDEEEEFRGPSKSHLKRVRTSSRKLSTTKSSNTAVCVISVLSVVSFS